MIVGSLLGLAEAVLALDLHNGVGTPRTLVLDTQDVRVRGTGSVNLRDEQFDLLLTPEPKDHRLLALGSAIRAHGSFRHAGYAIEKGTPPAANAGGADACGQNLAKSTALPAAGSPG